MKHEEWLLTYQDDLHDAYINEDYHGTFESYCNEQFEIYQNSEEV